MTLKSQFTRQDVFTGRRRLGPLGWLSVFIIAVFVGACLLGTYRWLTHNVARLAPPPSAQEASAVTAIPTSPVNAAATLTATPSITWTVWSAQDPLTGRPIYDGPPQIKAWALRDYAAAQDWQFAHLFEKDELLAHLEDYYTGDALQMERDSIRESFEKTHLIWAPLRAQPRQAAPLDQPVFDTFSADGRQLTLTDYTEAGHWKQYNTTTRALVPVQAHKFFWVYMLEYDPAGPRWKIVRLNEIFDIDANRAAYTHEP